jgi:hypothetical protein
MSHSFFPYEKRNSNVSKVLQLTFASSNAILFQVTFIGSISSSFFFRFCFFSNERAMSVAAWHNGRAHFKNVKNCLNTNIYSHLETSGGQSCNLYLNLFIFSTPVLIRHLWQLKTVVFLHWCLKRAVLLPCFDPSGSLHLDLCLISQT